MKAMILTALLLAGTAFGRSADADETTLKVVICAGQSNMVGKRSIASELPEELRGEQENLFFNGQTWVPLSPGITEKKGFGPEISFAKEFSAMLEERVGIIKHSRGGTSLAEKWSPANPNSLYAELLAKVAAARKGRNIQIVGMIWMQGEKDSKSSSMADAYAENLEKFIAAARNDFGSPQMPFVAGRVNPPKQRYAYVDEVRKAQTHCQADRYAFIDCDALEKGPDNLHYTTKGIVELGRTFAEAMMELTRRK